MHIEIDYLLIAFWLIVFEVCLIPLMIWEGKKNV